MVKAYLDEPSVHSVLGMCREIVLRIIVGDTTSFHLIVENIEEYTNKSRELDLETVKQSIGFLKSE